ncbi:MAG: NUDIX hydrolase, partial [Ardenticatenaceae bacterium]
MKVKTSTVRSAGGVVIREGERGLEALLIATHGKQRWSLPKGRIERDENPRAAAVREVLEETGIIARILAPLEAVEYWFYVTRRRRLHKFVEYYLMAYQEGRLVPQLAE